MFILRSRCVTCIGKCGIATSRYSILTPDGTLSEKTLRQPFPMRQVTGRAIRNNVKESIPETSRIVDMSTTTSANWSVTYVRMTLRPMGNDLMVKSSSPPGGPSYTTSGPAPLSATEGGVRERGCRVDVELETKRLGATGGIGWKGGGGGVGK